MRRYQLSLPCILLSSLPLGGLWHLPPGVTHGQPEVPKFSIAKGWPDSGPLQSHPYRASEKLKVAQMMLRAFRVLGVGGSWEGSPRRDLALLTQCNHTFMTIVTFDFWVGYLAGSDTVYLANFSLPDSPFLRVFKPKVAFLPKWVRIPLTTPHCSSTDGWPPHLGPCSQALAGLDHKGQIQPATLSAKARG